MMVVLLPRGGVRGGWSSAKIPPAAARLSDDLMVPLSCAFVRLNWGGNGVFCDTNPLARAEALTDLAFRPALPRICSEARSRPVPIAPATMPCVESDVRQRGPPRGTARQHHRDRRIR